MPTPFYHLELAEALLLHPALKNATGELLQRERAAFMLGSTAPDVQTISRQERHATHFYILPINKNAPLPWEVMLETYPVFNPVSKLPAAQAAFAAGYLCHLQADWLWLNDIFIPIFGPDCTWGNLRQRLYLHDVLRAYFDQIILAALPSDISDRLAQAIPDRWLPFVEDRFLYQWRDFLVKQLTPGASIQTVEVFAARQGIDPAEFYSLLHSQERMEQEVFSLVSRQQIYHYREQTLAAHLQFLPALLNPQEAWRDNERLTQ